MHEGAWASALQEAVEDLQAYLSDQVAPLLVVESVNLLLAQPPGVTADAIRSWVDAQLRSPGEAIAIGDYLFHAVKKVQMLDRLRLVESETLARFLDDVIEDFVGRAPEMERAPLRTTLRQAMAGDATFAATAQRLHRPAVTGHEGALSALTASQTVNAEIAVNMRQFAQLLERLGVANAAASAGTGAGKAAISELAPQLLAAAAQSAATQPELEQHLAALARAGLMTQVRLPEVFATLGKAVPNWWLAEGDTTPVVQSAPLQAMHRIVSLAANPEQTRAQFRELFKTAAQQLNEGSLARAVQVLDVARRLQEEGKVDKTSADLILSSAHEDLDHGQLMAQATQPANVPLLRRFLNAYPALTPAGLLLALDDEPDRARRRLWLALLEVHGPPARLASLDRLDRSFAEGAHDAHAMWRQRNFVYLLHRIRPPVGDDPQREVRLTARCADLANPAPLVREALLALGQRRHAEAESSLRQKLDQLERALEPPGSGIHDPPELRRMMGLAVSGLVRQGTHGAMRTVVEHGLKQKAHLGDTLERLAELGSQDLSGEPELVERLLATLRVQLPMRVLGVNLRRHDEGAYQVVRALQGTRSPAVRAAFQDVVKRFPQEPFGEVAAAALAAWAAAPATAPPAGGPAPHEAPRDTAPAQPAVSLAGDLEAFGLPELLQTLLQMQSSGRLVLRGRDGEVLGELLLREGSLVAAKVGQLPLPDAFYQLVEMPQPGTFEFTRQPAAAVPAGTPRDLMGLLMEGMRRYDELQRARALAPDHGYLHSTGTRPTSPPDSDGAFVRLLWTRVKDGATPRQCEESVAADAFRIRSLLAHWLGEGALALREAAENAAP